MTIYLDENLPPALANGFDTLQAPLSTGSGKNCIRVKSIAEEFGAGVADEDWIPKLDSGKDIVITQDYNINRIKEQRLLCEKHGLGMIYFRPPSKNGFTYYDMLRMLVKHWPEIVRKAQKEKRPFSFKITSRSASLDEI
ncbi:MULTISPECIES: hypothetical protein [unclassified Robiginitalea]|uniref:PIN-like domain-containing protein n=1 Tax=Robiginitalea TaxID=252306 RepID=UPI00234A6AE5|nr:MULTISPECIES: hypothetical protein [unclassified Robiginitalea]MDC6353278.1 hypothetical protein [Robiginitalea sp. PM2]MDC6373556.1 hypothetical protein [Robiginitalea sp. SP8]